MLAVIQNPAVVKILGMQRSTECLKQEFLVLGVKCVAGAETQAQKIINLIKQKGYLYAKNGIMILCASINGL